MKQSDIAKFILIAAEVGSCSYNDANKREFHRLGKMICRRLAVLMGLKAGDRDIRSNKAGIAVSGEVTLHTDHVYFQLSQSCCAGLEIMYRGCDGRKDYGSMNHPNQWMKFAELRDLDKVAATLKRFHERAAA